MDEKEPKEDEKVEAQVVETFLLFEVVKIIISFLGGLVLKSWWENSSYKPKWDNWWSKFWRKKNEKQ